MSKTDIIQTDLQIVLDSLPQAVLVADEDNKIRYANMAAENVFRTSSAYLLKHALERFIPFGSPILSLTKQVLSKRSPVNEYQIDISSPRIGEGKVVDIYAAPMADRSKSVILVFRERSMADRIDRQLSHRGAARSVSGLAAMLGHEIKNPLSGIRGAAQLLETVVGKQDKELARLITTETDRIVKIVDRMEAFSDETPLEREPVNMHSVLGHVRKIAKNGFGEHMHFREEYDPSLPPVSGNRDQLIQVFLNLVKNASEANQENADGLIMLRSAYRPGMHVSSPGSDERAALPLEFTVMDNGNGIPDDIRTHIFEPFVTTRINGSGLGLAQVAKTIGQHGGIIECDNHGAGTTFKIYLPAWQGNADAHIAEQEHV